MDTLRDFLAVLGHELRNPLASITTALEVMRLRGDDRFEKERAVIERQVLHVTRLVDDMLDVARIARGKLELRRERVDIALPIARAVEMTIPRFEAHGQRLTLDVERDLLVEVDPIRFAQAIANLLTNASKYSDPGAAVTLRATRSGNLATVAVRDPGLGISAEQLPRVFDAFVQGRRAADQSEGGLGIGLSLVKSLIELHGGTVCARSDGPGCGSEFFITVPALPEDAVESVDDDITAPLRVHPTAARRVLIIDDNVDAANCLGEVLRAVGHEVAVAYDGPGGLERARGFAYDVALVDIGLPEMDGYEVARRLRAQACGRPARYLALTGYGSAEDRELAREAGFDAHFVKPVDHDTIIEAVTMQPRRRVASPEALSKALIS